MRICCMVKAIPLGFPLAIKASAGTAPHGVECGRNKLLRYWRCHPSRVRHVALIVALCGINLVSIAQVPVDTFIDFEAGNSGDVVTSSLLNSCSHGDGTWHTEVNLQSANLQ